LNGLNDLNDWNSLVETRAGPMTSDVVERANPTAVEELLEIGREQLWLW